MVRREKLSVPQGIEKEVAALDNDLGEGESSKLGESSGVNGLIEVLKLVRLRVFLETQTVGADPEKIDQVVEGLELGLHSKNTEEREKANTKVNELLRIFDTGQDLSSDLSRPLLGEFAARISGLANSSVVKEMDRIESDALDLISKSKEERVEGAENLSELLVDQLEKMRLEGTDLENLTNLSEMIEEAKTRLDIQKLIKHYKNNGDAWLKDHILPKIGEPDPLEVRNNRLKKDSRAFFEEKLSKLRERLSEDLYSDGPGRPKIESRSESELVSMINDLSTWPASAKAFVGEGEGLARVYEIQAVFSRLEEKYLEEWSKRIVQSKQLGGRPVASAYVKHLLKEEVESRRGQARIAGKNRLNITRDDIREIGDAVEHSALSMEQRDLKRGVRSGVSLQDDESLADEMREQMKMGSEMYKGERFQYRNFGKAQEQMESLVDAPVVGDYDFFTNDDKRERAKEAVFKKFGRGPEGKRRAAEFDVAYQMFREQLRTENSALWNIEKLLHEGHYTAALSYMEAYLEDVGVREQSADWELAILMRRVKFALGKSGNKDLVGHFDLWTEQMYTRGGYLQMNDEGYAQRMQVVCSQDQMKYFASPELAFMDSVIVDLPVYENGAKTQRRQKKVLSSFAIYNAMKHEVNQHLVSGAPTNSMDNTQMRVMLNVLYGDGTKADFKTGEIRSFEGDLIGNLFNSDVKTAYYSPTGFQDIDYKEKDRCLLSGEGKLSTVGVLEQCLSKSRLAVSKWQWTQEQTTFTAKFNLDNEFTQANKGFAGYQGPDYEGHYGVTDPAWWEENRGGGYLQDVVTYKWADMAIDNMTDILMDGGGGMSRSEAAEFADVLGKKVLIWLELGEMKYARGQWSVDDVRLLGNNYNSAREAWPAFSKRLKMRDRVDVPDQLPSAIEVARVRAKKEKNWDSDDKKVIFWAEQGEQFFQRAKMLQWNTARKDADGKVVNEASVVARASGIKLKPLFDRLSIINAKEYGPGDYTIENLIKDFEFGSFVDPHHVKKATDIVDYGGYWVKHAEYVKLKRKFMGKIPDFETMIQMQELISSYQDSEGWAPLFGKQIVQKFFMLRTNRIKKYKVARRKEGKFRTDYYELKDKNNNTQYVESAIGLRTPIMEERRGHYYGQTRGYRSTLRQKDAEAITELMVGSRLLTKHQGEDLMKKMYGGKFRRFLWEVLLFDDPWWAAYTLASEYLKFFGEVGKEIVKV